MWKLLIVNIMKYNESWKYLKQLWNGNGKTTPFTILKCITQDFED